ncbi:substrate-binding domain-containing protein (plasmid) [Pseudorhodobacter turbinis]|uniref:Substrate-binding domain-containing protein n=1 Tax=Pseudorhodobacter turbinis TaxID=2500533 RepID=A0A4P8ELI8_9RHOB|nr:substrate-binding domain-containing protein [Pseudorhodobacter turbinis]QCO57675.1 substrate-binding domain-containing protein [Pseudorhodobacter turbinis]
MKVTAKEIALAVGTSVSAVSRAFRPDASLADPLRQKILLAAAEMGYVIPAHRIATQTGMRIVSLVVGDVMNPFYPSILEEFSSAALASGIHLNLHIIPQGKTVDSVIGHVLHQRPHAVIVTSAMLSSELAVQCLQKGLPVVLFNRVQINTALSAVCCDNYAGARQVANLLVNKGYQRIAFVGGIRNTSTHMERWRGFEDRMAEADMPVFKTVSGDFNYDVAFASVRDLLKDGRRPDAVFCANDIMAIAAIDAAKSEGFRIPDDLGVVGFDDTPMAAWRSYRLTTVRQRIRLMVQDTFKLISQLIEDPAAAGTIRITPSVLMERDSA